MREIRDELMWAIGLFEGEGCINVYGGCRDGRGWWRKNALRLILSSTDRDVIERFARVVGLGRFRDAAQIRVGKQPIWIWTASGRDAETVLRRFLPELGDRRRRTAIAALEETVPGEDIEQLRMVAS